MPFTNTAKNSMLDGLPALYVSAHTAAPGETGLSEVSGGSYARVAVTFNAAATGNLDSSNAPVLNIPAGTTVTHVGVWDAATAGNFMGWHDITDEAFGSDGTLTVSDLDLNLT